MSGTPTTNYSFPTYAAEDAPNLEGAYNQAMTKIDETIKTLADRVQALEDAGGTVAKFEGVTNLTVSDLAGMKFDANNFAGKGSEV